MLSREEEDELMALESEFGQSPVRTAASAPQRKPGDIELLDSTVIMSPDEDAELVALEAEYGDRNSQAPVNSDSFVSQLGSAVDQYSGAASVRKGMGTLIDTGDIRQAASDAVDQYSMNPDFAPTTKENFTKLGLSDQPRGYVTNPKTGITRFDDSTDAGTLATIADVTVLDPVNIITALPFAKLIKGGKEAAKATAQGVSAVDNVVTGGKFVKAGEFAADTSKATIEATNKAKNRLVKLFKPDVSPDFEDSRRIAQENNINPDLLNESHQFGENSVISRQARSNAEGPLGGDALIKHDELERQISGAVDNKLKKISVSDNVPDRQSAGAILREGYEEGVKSFFDKMDFTYDSIIQQVPGIRLTPDSAKIIDSKMNGIEKTAKGLMKRGISATDRSQGSELVRAVEAYRNAGPSLKRQKEAMNMIGRVAFKTGAAGAELPSDIRTLREMYFSLQKGFTESVRSQLGDEIAEALIKNNSEMSRHFSDRSSIAKVLERSKASEEVFTAIMENGDSQEIAALKEIMTMSGDESKWKQLKGAYLKTLMNRNSDGKIMFKSTRKKLNGVRDRLKNIYDENELYEVDDILKLGDRGGIGVLSTSGTGGSVKFGNLKNTFTDFVVSDAMVANMKKGGLARANYVETPNGLKKLEKVAEVPKKSGMKMLKDGSGLTRSQLARASASGSKAESINDRNKKLETIKRLKRLN